MSDTELKPLWSDNKTDEDIVNSTPIGASATVYNLLEDIKCLKESRTNAKAELIKKVEGLRSSHGIEFAKIDDVIEAIEELDV